MTPSARTIAITRRGASGCFPPSFSKATRRRPSSSSAGSARSSSCKSSGCRAGASRRASSCSIRSSTRPPITPRTQRCSGFATSRAKGIIFNFIREYGDLDYVNVGCVPESLVAGPSADSRAGAGVYLGGVPAREASAAPSSASCASRNGACGSTWTKAKTCCNPSRKATTTPTYWLDRRLGCRQLGMNLTRRVAMRRVSEVYNGTNARFRGEPSAPSTSSASICPALPPTSCRWRSMRGPATRAKLAELLGRPPLPA